VTLPFFSCILVYAWTYCAAVFVSPYLFPQTEGPIEAMGKLLVLLLLAFLASTKAECFSNELLGEQFSRCETMDSFYSLFWNISGNELTVGIHVQIKDAWAGVGTSVNGGMRGADIAVARLVAGKYVVEDRFVPGLEGEPKLDVHQDVKLVKAQSDNTTTSIIFTRQLIPCDVDEDIPIREDETPIIFAYGKGQFGYHGENRGSKVLYFHYVPETPLLPEDTKVIQLTFPTYTIPAKDTTYVCSPVELPSQQKSHIIRWRPLIKPGSELYVHHIVIFTCPAAPKSTTPWECGMAPQECSGILVAWSVGQTGNDWLGDYAFPLGADDEKPYAVLQMHYNNPLEVAGVVDNSGIELYYTTKLRKYDMANLGLSTPWHTKDFVIPPQVEATSQSAECTEQLNEGVTIVNYFPHMHQIGSKIWMQHIRNGVELPEIHRDNHYDFQRQQSYNVHVPLLPGDTLRLTCVWNSMSRKVNTTGGESSSQEMCVALMQYYPKSQISCVKNATAVPYLPLPTPVSTCAEEADVNAAGNVVPLITMVLFVAAMMILM